MPIFRRARSHVMLLCCLALVQHAAAQEPAKSHDQTAAPQGATGICNNGDYVFVAERRGSCTGRKGIREWFGSRPESDAASSPAAVSAGPAPGANAGTADADSAVKVALLAPNGFDVDWVCGTSRGGSRVTFRMDEQKILVDVSNLSRGSCTREAHLSPTGATWSGCNDLGINMTFDPADKSVPFSGQSASCSYRFKVR